MLTFSVVIVHEVIINILNFSDKYKTKGQATKIIWYPALLSYEQFFNRQFLFTAPDRPSATCYGNDASACGSPFP
jgi:hypothetical protein